MSMKESEEIIALPHDDKKKILYPQAQTNTTQPRGNRFSKSASVDTLDSNTSAIHRTKAAFEAHTSGNSSIALQLRKTISCGGINAPPTSKVVLRRWTSTLHEREENLSKRHSSSSLYQGGRAEKILFRPVSSILLSTPWEKDFKGNIHKPEADDGTKAEDTLETNKRHGTVKESLINPNSCSINKQERSKVLGSANEIVHPGLDLSSSQETSDKAYNNSGDKRKEGIHLSKVNGKNFIKDIGDTGYVDHLSKRLTEPEQVCKANYELDERAVIPQIADYHRDIVKHIDEQDRKSVIPSSSESNENSLENMPLSTGSYYYKSKYVADIASNEPSLRRGNYATYARRLPETSYSTAFGVSRSLSTDKSGKETVAEVDAYISAYKSRRERSFEYGESSLQSYMPVRSERKSSFEQPQPLYQSQAARTLSSGYGTAPGSALETGKLRQTFSRTLEKDFSSSRPSRFLSKTDRSRSFDVEPMTYSSFTRTGSGGRYPWRTITSTGSSSSSSKSQSPPDRDTWDYTSDLVSSKTSGTSSILSSDALTPSERAFFSTSRLQDDLSDKGATRQRKSSLDSARFYPSHTTNDAPRQRPLSLIGKLSQTTSSGNEKRLVRSATISTDSDGDKSSRSRIMGGILSRFFTEEEPLHSSMVPTVPTIEERKAAEAPVMVETTEGNEFTSSENKPKEIDKDVSPTLDSICGQVEKSDGDSTVAVGSSPSVMSKDGSKSVPRSGQIVRVKSVFVEEGDTEGMGKDKAQKSVQKTEQSGKENSKGLAEAKELESTQHSRERHSSWIGRSLRRISSSAKSTPEEPLDKTEKPKRERRRSLLRRLGRDSKSTEIVESVAQDTPNDVVVAKPHDGKEDKKVGKKEERKGEKKEEKKEEKGITNYLRRSSRRKKSQVSEREILEARQETQTKLREENHVIEQEIPLSSTEISQSETGIYQNDAAEKHELDVNRKPETAPLAQAEDSGDDMSSNSNRKSRFAEVLQQKEKAAAAESQRSTALSNKMDSGSKKAAVKSTSSYLSSKFMKSRTMFEAKDEKSSVEPKKGTAASRPLSRRFTQEPVEHKEVNEVSKTEVGKDRSKAGMGERRALFQKSHTRDIPTSSDIGRVPLRERNKDLLVSSSNDKDVSKESSSEEKGFSERNGVSKLPARRLVSDSAIKLRSSENYDEQSTEEENKEKVKVERKDNEDCKVERGSSEKTKKDISKSININDTETEMLLKCDGPNIGDRYMEKGQQEVVEKETNQSGNFEDNKAVNSVSSSSDRKSDLESEKDVPLDKVEENVEALGKQLKVNENIPDVEQELRDMRTQLENIQLERKLKEAASSEVKAKLEGNSDLKEPRTISESGPGVESDIVPSKDTLDDAAESKEIAGERVGARRRRERRANRMKQVDPVEIEKMKEQMRRDSNIDLGLEDNSKHEAPAELVLRNGKVDEEIRDERNSIVGVQLATEKKEREDEKEEDKNVHKSNEMSLAGSSDTVDAQNKLQRKEIPRIGGIIDEKLSETDTGDESAGSTGSSTKLTTRSVIKDKIRQKKFDKQLRKERTMSLPIGVDIIVTPPIEKKPEVAIEINGTRSPLLQTKPPVMPKVQRSQEADDIATAQKKTKRPLRSRPKTLTQGIDPSLLVSDMKAKEEAVVVEERLSISQLKQRLLESESGARTPRTPDVQRKNKRRSGKRYKTITEGIAPGLLEAAHQLASSDHDSNRLGVDQMNRLNMALSASTENLKRRSFIVSEVNSRIGSVGASLATSMEDLSMKENGNDGEKMGGSLVEESIKKLKKLPMVVDSDEDDPMPSVSSLKQKFLQAVEDSYKPVKNQVNKRGKGRQRDRPFTISGLDDVTMLQLRHSIDEKNERDRDEKASEIIRDAKMKKGDSKQLDELAEDELESMLKAEGLTADQLASELGINPSLAQGSPLRARKPFLGTTTEESADDVIEAIHDTHEELEKDTKPLGELRSKFMDAMSEFRSGSFDKETPNNVEEKTEVQPKKERRIGVVEATERLSIDVVEENEPKSDLDFVSQNVSQLQSITDRRHLKPQRKQRSSANPVKTLQARSDLITEVGSNKTTENKHPQSQGGEKSVGAKLWRKVALASEAKAALQSTEDFSKVKLKKVKAPGQSVNGEPAEAGGVVESTVTNLLLQVKGRRHVQIHVVEFSTDSLSSNDSFVVVTPKDLLCWHGKDANVIEKAKAAEIASRINQKKEMGCKAFEAVYFEQDGPNDSKVFRTLDYQGTPAITETTEHDEDYERRMMNSSMVFSLQDSDPPELIPVYDMCQRSPSKEILKTDEIFVFDFVSEVYVWIGRQTPSGLRKKMMKLGRDRFDMGYYKAPSLAPQVHHGKSRKISLTATDLPTRKQSINRKLSVSKFLQDKENLVPRPSCAIFLSMFEGAEWVIFKEKFCDWPDESRIIRMKGGPQTVGELPTTVRVSDVKPVDPLTMLSQKFEPLLRTFEGTEVDRGQGKPKGPDGYHIVTRCVQVWHVTERSRTLLPQTSNGQFHSGEGFVIRWEYSIVASRVMKMLKDMEEAKAAGRHRCAYFFWLGNDCAVTEQGATAVMTVDLDEERGPHVRVIQGKEPPCFLNLFDGGMVIHAGKRKSKLDKATFSDRSVVRLYCVRSEIPSEACLLQVPVCATSLRSRSSFVLVLCKQGEIFLWHGSKSSDATRATAIQGAHRLIENHPEEALLSEKDEIFLTEIDEGHEPDVFWVALGGEDYYGSLLSDLNTKWDFVPRCFHLSSATGQFIANEITNPSINPKEACPFPFLQDDLYDAYQPAIFIIDAIHEVYLWLGWWPEDEDSENSDAQRMRWDVDKRKAMESVVLYAKEAGRSLSHCYVVDAGLEPEQFIHLFPYWIVQEDITEIQIEDGRIDSDKLQLLTKKLEGFTREFFSIDELIQRPLPEGVNPSKLETYLSDEDFFDIFRMSREEFKRLPLWRRDNLKKSVGLY